VPALRILFSWPAGPKPDRPQATKRGSGPRLGAKVREVKRALQAGEFEERGDGSLLAAGELLAPEEVIRGERHVLPGWAIAEEDGLSVAFDTAIDDGLRIEGRVYDLIHRLNAMRREQGLALTDRVIVTLPARERDLEPHFGWISSEVLAREVRFDPAIAEPTVALA
jgi:isoleucyl-tRNA synthetase